MTWTQLHDLCGESASNPDNAYAIVRRARAVSEEAIRVDDRGFTPLHIAVASCDPPVEVIEALLNANPNAVREKVRLDEWEACMSRTKEFCLFLY